MRNFLVTLLVCLTCLSSFNLSAQESTRQYKIGLSVWSGYPESVKGFKESLAEAGLVEGKNVQFFLANAHANKQTQQQIAEGFSTQNLDLIYSLTTPGTVILKNTVDTNTPIVFSIVTYPADSGLIESFEYSGNNLVGTSNFVPLKHYVRLLKQMLPEAKKLAIFHRKGEPNSKIQASNLRRLFRREGITVIDMQPESISDVIDMAKSVASKVDAFVTTTDTLMQSGGELALIDVSEIFGVPILSSNKKGIEQGATFGPVSDFYTLGQMSGKMAVKILTQNIPPQKIESQLQNPPTILVNKKSLFNSKIKIPETLRDIIYVD